MGLWHRAAKRLNYRLAAAAFVAALLVLPTAAAPLLSQPGGRGGSAEQVRPFDLDQNPCTPQRQRARGGEQGFAQGCPSAPFASSHDDKAPRHPGSNAFGLQFDYAD
jgi:hypothetical protein